MVKLVLTLGIACAGAWTAIAARPHHALPASGPDASLATDDTAFARDLWKAMKGYRDWKLTTKVYRGASPHGKWVRLFSTFVRVGGKDYPVIVKENYGGRGVTPDRVREDHAKWLKAVTIMLKREPGYDKQHLDWYWVKYTPAGEIAKNPRGETLAGKVQSCNSCHSQAAGADGLYSNDG